MGVQIKYKKAWCAKQHGISEINGSFEDAYNNSPNTATTSKRAIPSVLLLLTPPPMVDFVICFSASVRVRRVSVFAPQYCLWMELVKLVSRNSTFCNRD